MNSNRHMCGKVAHLKDWIGGYVLPFVIWYLLFGLDLQILRRLMPPSETKEICYLIIQPGCYAALCMAFVILLGKYRWVLVPIYVYVFVIELMELVLLLMFKAYFLGDLLLIILNSSKEEIFDFVGVFLSLKTGALVVLLVVVGYITTCTVFRRNYQLKLATRAYLFTALCCPFVFLNVCYMSVRLLPSQMLCIYFLSDTITAYESNAEFAQASRDPLPYGNVKINAPDDANLFGVIVVGESMTRNNMQVYGYARETTPRMCSLENIYTFRDLLSSWSNTQGALKFLLTEKELTGGREALCVLPEVCRRAGYHCVLMSNQNHWGCYDTLDTMMFSACHEATWIKELESNNMLYDVDMVNMLEMCYTNGPTMVFMHLYGSHYPCKAYDQGTKKFPEDLKDKYTEGLNESQRRLYNQYDNTIEMTDRTFYGIVNLVKKTHRPGFVMLVSDHGEMPRVGMRVTSDLDLWEIPMVVWISDEYKELYPEVSRQLENAVSQKLQQDQLFVGMLTLSQIMGYSRYDDKRDFLSPNFVPRTHRMVCNGTEIYALDQEGRK